MSRWSELGRPTNRIVLSSAGVYLYLIAQLYMYLDSPPPVDYYYWDSSANSDVLQALGLGLLIMLGLTGAVLLFLRKALAPDRWWSKRWFALNVTGLSFGLGVSAIGTFCFEYGARQLAPVLVFLLPPLGTLLLAIFERGRRPVLAIFLGILLGSIYAFHRLVFNLNGRLGSWDAEELIVLIMTASVLLPFGYLMIKAMMVLVSGQLGGGGLSPLAGGPPPLELVRRGGELLARLEAPGLGDVGGVQVEVDDGLLLVRAELPRPPTDGLLFSSRRGGPFAVKARLPVAVASEPLDVAVANGVIEIRLAPRGEATPQNEASPQDEAREDEAAQPPT